MIQSNPIMCGSFYELQMPQQMVIGKYNQAEFSAMENLFLEATKWKEDTSFRIGWLDPGRGEDRSAFRNIVDSAFNILKLDITWGVPLENSNIRVTFNTDQFKSVIGSDASDIPKSEPTLWIGNVTNRGAVIHQFCHALGMIHEIDLPQDFNVIRGVMRQYMKKVYNYSPTQINYGILPSFNRITTNNIEYDQDSVMNYAFANYSNNQNKTVPYKTKLSVADISFLDKRFNPNKEQLVFGIQDAARARTNNTRLVVVVLFTLLPILLGLLIFFIYKILQYKKQCP